MGSCLSKKKDSSSSSSSSSSVAVDATLPVSSKTVPVDVDPVKSDDNNNTQTVEVVVQAQKQEPGKREEGKEGKEKGEEGLLVKKEMVKHRKSHERRSTTTTTPPQQNEPAAAAVVVEEEMGNGRVRTSSCTKEEVDAILIQCGRLSRSNSSGKTVASSGRKYSGSKRSYDFDHNDVDRDGGGEDDGDLKKKVSDEDDEKRQHRQLHRQSSSRHSSSPSQGRRRRTPSREREQRSGSRERGNGGGNNTSSGGRRVSRSPGRRSENNNTTTNNGASNRPGKMVSVPATVTSLAMDKSNNSNNGGGGASEPPSIANGGVKRISVKKNAGGGDQAFGGAAAGSRTAASPRSQSPLRANQQQPSLSRSSSRKAEHSPHRRNPLSEIDPNSLAYPQSAANNKSNRVQNKTREIEADGVMVKEFSTNLLHQAPIQKPEIVAHQKPQPVTRSRSSRLSRDLDINPETLMNSSPLYNALLLEDIQSFHQKNSNNTPSISLPACVSKACSILEAVADLNSSSTTSSNLSAAFSEDRKGFPADHLKKKKMPESNCRDPFVESEVVGSDDLMEPSFHKYVTVRRGGGVDDLDDQESSGSNSIVGGSQQKKKNWSFSSSSWEPNSAESTDRWTSRSSHTRDQSPLGGRTKREDSSDYEKVGIGRGRVGAGGSKGGGLHTVPAVGVSAMT